MRIAVIPARGGSKRIPRKNIRAFADAVARAKPTGAKGTYIQRVAVSSTMGPGVKVGPGTLLGFTATTARGDGKGLDSVFEEIVYARTLPDLIDEGYLAPLKGFRIATAADLTRLSSAGSDFADAELAEAVDIQERNALARLNHPHIARLLDAGASEDGLPYFVMEYVDGRPIHEAALGLSLEHRLRLFLQLADAVAHAHRQLLRRQRQHRPNKQPAAAHLICCSRFVTPLPKETGMRGARAARSRSPRGPSISRTRCTMSAAISPW